jgi:hypothetical protein
VALDPDPDRNQPKNFPTQPDLDPHNAESKIKYRTNKIIKKKLLFKTLILNTFQFSKHTPDAFWVNEFL